jgi:phosphoribosylaminoimidazolecarboxamide formyltransferase / IMP cyclohydrolase
MPRASRWPPRLSRTPPPTTVPSAGYLSSFGADGIRSDFPRILTRQWFQLQDMRYGENPHQRAAFYRDAKIGTGLLAAYRQVQGKELSFNNVVDADAAWECVRSLLGAHLRHRQARQSLRRGHRAHRPSRRTGVRSPPIRLRPSAASLPLTAASTPTARAVNEKFAEVVIAPGFDAEAMEAFAGEAQPAGARTGTPARPTMIWI